MAEPPLLDLVVLEDRGTARVMLVGELDLTAAAPVRTTVARILDDLRVESIEMDMFLLDFCDSHGMGVLLAAHRQAAEQQVGLRLVGISPPVQRLLNVFDPNCLLSAPP